MKVYLRVAKRLVAEPHPPRPLRWLLVFALLPIPGPIDELDELQQQLGHSSISVTSDIYVHIPASLVADKSARAAAFEGLEIPEPASITEPLWDTRFWPQSAA